MSRTLMTWALSGLLVICIGLAGCSGEKKEETSANKTQPKVQDAAPPADSNTAAGQPAPPAPDETAAPAPNSDDPNVDEDAGPGVGPDENVLPNTDEDPNVDIPPTP